MKSWNKFRDLIRTRTLRHFPEHGGRGWGTRGLRDGLQCLKFQWWFLPIAEHSFLSVSICCSINSSACFSWHRRKLYPLKAVLSRISKVKEREGESGSWNRRWLMNDAAGRKLFVNGYVSRTITIFWKAAWEWGYCNIPNWEKYS